MIRAPEPLRRFRGPALSGARCVASVHGPVRTGLTRRTAPARCHASCAFAAASIAASDFRTWLRSVVNQKSGSDAFRKPP